MSNVKVKKSVAEAGKRKVTVVMINACLESVKTKRGIELVTADSHVSILKKLKKAPADYRPDILHQCLLTLLDSPLNKAGHLQVYIQTTNNVLIEVSPTVRIPRTFKRFAGLMVQLLYKLKIRAADGPDVLLKVIKNPVTQHLPPNALRFGTSVTGELVNIQDFIEPIQDETPVVFTVGAHAHGPAEVEWTEKLLALSQYPCSASVILGRLCGAFETKWGIL